MLFSPVFGLTPCHLVSGRGLNYLYPGESPAGTQFPAQFEPLNTKQECTFWDRCAILQSEGGKKHFQEHEFSGLYCMKTASFCGVTAAPYQCVTQCFAHGSAASSYCCYLWSEACRQAPRSPLCFKHRMARGTLLSVFPGYWKRPLAGGWGPLLIWDLCLFSSKWPYHISVHILINNKVYSVMWRHRRPLNIKLNKTGISFSVRPKILFVATINRKKITPGSYIYRFVLIWTQWNATSNESITMQTR